jgi:hypothetical protein
MTRALNSRLPGRKRIKRLRQGDQVGSMRVSEFQPAVLLEPSEFRTFDPWLTSNHRFLGVLAENVAHRYEELSPRQRQMKVQDRSNVEMILKTVLANIAFSIAIGIKTPNILVSLRAPKRKLNRYDRRGFALLPKVLEALSIRGTLIELRKSNQRGIASSFAPSPSLLADINRFRLKPEHFSWEPGTEAIRLSVTRRDFVTRSKTIELVDYADTDETDALRYEMSSINSYLRAATLSFEDDGGPPVLCVHRDLIRHFKTMDADTQRFDLAGRLFGGWWQELPSNRRHAIRIDGEPVADLDFASAFLRLAYLEVGAKASTDDLYARIPGVNAELYRDGLKQIISAMLFRESPLVRIPSELKDHLPRNMTGSDIRSAVLAAFPEIADVFESGIGLRLMFRESQILVRGLRLLAEMNVCGLGMHDGIMVPRSKAELAAHVMADASRAITGAALPILLKRLY